jgi:hypothetical protein
MPIVSIKNCFYFSFLCPSLLRVPTHMQMTKSLFIDVDKHRNIDFFEVETYGTSWDTAFKSLHDALRFGDPNATYTVRIPNEHGNISKKIIINN